MTKPLTGRQTQQSRAGERSKIHEDSRIWTLRSQPLRNDSDASRLWWLTAAHCRARDPAINTYGLCGYDDHGNLFLDGVGSANIFAELPKGSSTFVNFVLDGKFDAFGSVQWDGKYVTLSNPSALTIDRLKISKSSLKVVGTTHVNGWHNSYSCHWPYIQTWLEGNTFLAQSSARADLGLWPYPQGGNAREIIGPFKSGAINIYGIAVSLGPRYLRSLR
jgi:hypothetical protein